MTASCASPALRKLCCWLQVLVLRQCLFGCPHDTALVLRDVAAHVAAECCLKQQRSVLSSDMLHAIPSHISWA